MNIVFLNLVPGNCGGDHNCSRGKSQAAPQESGIRYAADKVALTYRCVFERLNLAAYVLFQDRAVLKRPTNWCFPKISSMAVPPISKNILKFFSANEYEILF